MVGADAGRGCRVPGAPSGWHKAGLEAPPLACQLLPPLDGGAAPGPPGVPEEERGLGGEACGLDSARVLGQDVSPPPAWARPPPGGDPGLGPSIWMLPREAWGDSGVQGAAAGQVGCPRGQRVALRQEPERMRWVDCLGRTNQDPGASPSSSRWGRRAVAVPAVGAWEREAACRDPPCGPSPSLAGPGRHQAALLQRVCVPAGAARQPEQNYLANIPGLPDS